MRSIFAAACLLLLASPAAADQAATAKTSGTEGTPATDRKICKADPNEPDTGSKIRRQICKLESEWKGSARKGPDVSKQDDRQAQ